MNAVFMYVNKQNTSYGNLSFYDDSTMEEAMLEQPLDDKIQQVLNQGGRHCIEPITIGEVVSLCVRVCIWMCDMHTKGCVIQAIVE